MNQIFAPQNAFSENLLKSIPRKVFFWLGQLPLSDEQRLQGSFNGLEWKFGKTERSTSFIRFHDVSTTTMEMQTVEILWNGKQPEIKRVRGNQSYFEKIDMNLTLFTELEMEIYGTLSDYELKLERNLQALQAA